MVSVLSLCEGVRMGETMRELEGETKRKERRELERERVLTPS